MYASRRHGHELPLVAVIGRPNVGKSSLVNRMSSGKEAIIEETAGVTRDRNFIETDWNGRRFCLIDTGGIDFETGDEIVEGVTRQAFQAAAESDIVLHIVDGRQGPTAADSSIADELRQGGRPVHLIVNKLDDARHEDAVYDFYELGEGEPYPVSAAQGRGIGELLDLIVEALPESPAEEEPEEEEGILALAIVGRPNAGKSSMLNRMLGEERVLVSDVPGTTRDSIHTRLRRGDEEYLLIDTAGIRRKNSTGDRLEYYSIVRALRAIDRADVVLLLIDAVEGVTDADQRIARMAIDRGCGVVVAFNKWDLLQDGAAGSDELRQELEWSMPFLKDPLVVTASALSGRHVGEIFKAVRATEELRRKHIGTGALNRFVTSLSEHQPPLVRGRRLRIYYATQAEGPPPTFVFFVNDPRLTDDSYNRYLSNSLCREFGFRGSPVVIHMRGKE